MAGRLYDMRRKRDRQDMARDLDLRRGSDAKRFWSNVKRIGFDAAVDERERELRR